MAGYVYRDKARQKCAHISGIWDPPDREVATVACPYCHAKPNGVCTERGRRVEPHASRYIAHHDATCKTGADWTRKLPATTAEDSP